MSGKNPMSATLMFLTNAAAGIAALVTSYLTVMALLALIGMLPNNMDASFELPIRVHLPLT